ncbi:MAG: carbohydrate-binding domain-containing protein [Clostridia bacterium]|nr:carbohydrate-binding domain-containing protein [Clostridia bacterium]
MKRTFMMTILSMLLAMLMMLGALAENATLAEVAAQNINLDEITGQLVIDSAGVYTLSGTLAGGVVVDPGEGDVTLVLNGATIESADTAGIAAISGDALTIVLAEGTENAVSDGGSDDDYDAAIYSAVALTFDGAGALTVNGNNQEGISTENADMTFNGGVFTVTSQDDGINAGGDDGGLITFNGGEFTINSSGDGIDSNAAAVFNGGAIYVVGSAAGGDAGIDTDDGYTIYGGSIIAIGTDMIETPTGDTTQTTLALSLEDTIEEGSAIVLADADGNAVAEFTALQSFRTLIVSSDALTAGSYTLYADGEAVSVDGANSVEITDTVTSVGSMGFGPGGMGPDGAFGPDGMEPPEGMGQPGAFNPDGMGPDGDMTPPDGMERPELPDGMQGEPPAFGGPEADNEAN